MEHHRGHRSVIYRGDVGSACEWCQIKLRTSCDVPAALNHVGTTVIDILQSFSAPAVVVIYNFCAFFFQIRLHLTLTVCTKTYAIKTKNP